MTRVQICNSLTMSLVITSTFVMSIAHAQTAFRCEEGGKAVYSDKPCVAGRAVAPTQETDAQRARSEKANAQLRADNAAVNRDIKDREQLDAKERAANRAKATAEKRSAGKAKKGKTKTSGSKVKASKNKAAKKSKR